MTKKYEDFMKEALKEAKKAYTANEIPVGAVIVKNNKIISRGYNTREKTNNIANHAEIIALQEAAHKLKTWKLDSCDIYITLDPCLMCYGAIKQSRIRNIYVALKGNDNKEYSYRNYINDTTIKSNILKEESYKLLNSFFLNKRKKAKKDKL